MTIDAFKLWCWRRLLRVPWTPRRSNQSILKEMNPEYPLEGLKQQYFGHLMQRADTLEKTLILGKRRGQQRTRAGWHHWLDGHEFEQSQGIVKDRGAWRAVIRGVSESGTTEQLKSNRFAIV